MTLAWMNEAAYTINDSREDRPGGGGPGDPRRDSYMQAREAASRNWAATRFRGCRPRACCRSRLTRPGFGCSIRIWPGRPAAWPAALPPKLAIANAASPSFAASSPGSPRSPRSWPSSTCLPGPAGCKAVRIPTYRTLIARAMEGIEGGYQSYPSYRSYQSYPSYSPYGGYARPGGVPLLRQAGPEPGRACRAALGHPGTEGAAAERERAGRRVRRLPFAGRSLSRG